MKDRRAERKPPRRRSAALRGAVLLALAALAAWLAWGNAALTVSRVTVRGARIPAGFDGFRIAQVSDLHDAQFGSGNEKLLALLAGCEPDIIVMTGDLIDANRTDIDLSLEFAEGAAGIAPVYYVTGNHEGAIMEYWVLREGLLAAGVTVLNDRAVRLTLGGDALLLAGLDDPNFATREEISEGFPAMIRGKLARLTEGNDDYTVLLAHRPEYIGSYAAGGADLVLSGHAHGGQIRLPFIGGLAAPGQGLFPKYDAGLYTVDGSDMVVSRGLGNSIFPLRVNNRPEIVLITLECE